ncbi:MepB family protein [Listeria seeligeri]|uniref:MepB family protein n=1 Tax=Listeria seeligeri TaxID=1640 RepID=UPI001889827A|nr:MepB family protein [Listeria seeligeri]MBF2400424.1 MepB family protein [Listeria seeligeri]
MRYQALLEAEFGAFEIVQYEKQNKEYQGMVIKTAKDGCTIRTRLAKKTEKKEGYFVAFDKKDSPDFLCIVVNDEDLQGLFVIPKQVLVEKGILRSEGIKGKMAVRFYPAWCENLNKTAQKTQKWQLDFFKDYS